MLRNTINHWYNQPVYTFNTKGKRMNNFMHTQQKTTDTDVVSYNDLHDQIATQIGMKGGVKSIDKDSAQAVITTESAHLRTPAFDADATNANKIIDEALGASSTKISNAQRASGAIAYIASGDLSGWSDKQAETPTLESAKNTFAGGHTAGHKVTLENYDNTALKEVVASTVAYNTGAANQQPEWEMAYPTIALPPSQSGVQYAITRQTVHEDIRHTSGDELNRRLRQKPLLWALVDSKVLDNDPTRAVPTYRADQNWCDTEVGQIKVDLGGMTVTSGAIKFGERMNLIGASQPKMLSGVRDFTDTLDRALTLDTVYLEIIGQNGKKSIIPVSVGSRSGANFLGSVQGSTRDTTLTFETGSVTISGKTRDIHGNVAEALEGLEALAGDHYIQLGLTVNGSVHLDDGTTRVTAAPVEVNQVLMPSVKNGVTVYTPVVNEQEKLSVLATIQTIEPRSYTLLARFTNLNRRETGHFIRETTETIQYEVGNQAPISVRSDIVHDMSSSLIDTAVNTTRMMNSVAAMREMFRAEDTLSNYKGSATLQDVATGDNLGLGGFAINPYYQHITADVQKSVNNLTSSNKLDDIGAFLCNVSRDAWARAIMVSGYRVAAQCAGASADEKPEVLMITDEVTMQYLNRTGDTRILGTHYNAHVQSSTFLELRDEIYMLPYRKASMAKPDGLHWGNMLWIPQIATNEKITRNNQISREFTVQPRRLHVTHSPLMVRISVKNLHTAITEKTTISVTV